MKTKIHVSILILLIGVLLVPHSRLLSFEKVGVTSFQFLKVMTDARSTAMGEAFTAVCDGSNAMFWNPAALTQVTRFDASVSYLDWFLDTGHFSAAAVYSLKNVFSVGVMGLVANYGDFEVTDVAHLGFIGDVYNPGLTGEKINPGANVFGIGAARRLTDKFAFGIVGKYATENLDVKSKSLAMADAGITYNTGFRTLQVAATVRNFGHEVKYYDKGYPLPQTFNIGLSAYLTAPKDAMFFRSNRHRLLMAFDMVQPRDYDQQYNFGLEYSFANLLFLRGGYKLNYDEEGLSLGFGVHYGMYRIDYSYCDFGKYLDSVHRFSVGFGNQ